MGRRVLESPRSDNCEMLLATRDRYGDDIDVADRLAKDGREEESEGRIAAFFGESVFLNDGQIESDGLDEKDIYVALGDDSIKDIETELGNRVSEAVRNGLSKKGESNLKNIIKNNISVFYIRLGCGGPAKANRWKLS